MTCLKTLKDSILSKDQNCLRECQLINFVSRGRLYHSSQLVQKLRLFWNGFITLKDTRNVLLFFRNARLILLVFCSSGEQFLHYFANIIFSFFFWGLLYCFRFITYWELLLFNIFQCFIEGKCRLSCSDRPHFYNWLCIFTIISWLLYLHGLEYGSLFLRDFLSILILFLTFVFFFCLFNSLLFIVVYFLNRNFLISI